MAEVREKFVVDANGKPTGVIVSLRQYRAMLRDLEELESIRAYDRAKAAGDEAVPFEQAVREIEENRR